MTNPAWGSWPTDDDAADHRHALRAVAEGAPEIDLLLEAEARVDARPRRTQPQPRTPYRGARQDRSALPDAALRGLRRGAR